VSAAAAFGLKRYGQGVLKNWFTQFLRRDGAVLGYRGLEMAQQGRELAAIAAFYRSCGVLVGEAGPASTQTLAKLASECDPHMLLDNLPSIQGVAGILRKRRAKAQTLPKMHPAYGCPFGNDEADLWHRTTEMAGGQRTELPFLSIASEMYRGFNDLGEVLEALGQRFSSQPAIAEGKAMLAEAASLLPDLQTALARTAQISRKAGGPCPFSFVAGGDSCTVADARQPKALQTRENEPWRTYSELMYSSVLPINMTLDFLKYAEANDKAMKLGVLSGSGGSASGAQLQTFTIAGFGNGLLLADEIDRFQLLLYSVATQGCTRGTWVCAESTSIDRDTPAVKYATPSQLSIPIFVRWMLAFEDSTDSSLVLAKAVPREWFGDAQFFAAQDVPTRYGVLTYSYTVRARNATKSRVAAQVGELTQPLPRGSQGRIIDVNVSVSSLAWTFPAGGLKLRVRSPHVGGVIVAASIMGKALVVPAADRTKSVVTVYETDVARLLDLQNISITMN
jgi:hypothetical protein